MVGCETATLSCLFCSVDIEFSLESDIVYKSHLLSDHNIITYDLTKLIQLTLIEKSPLLYLGNEENFGKRSFGTQTNTAIKTSIETISTDTNIKDDNKDEEAVDDPAAFKPRSKVKSRIRKVAHKED